MRNGVDGLTSHCVGCGDCHGAIGPWCGSMGNKRYVTEHLWHMTIRCGRKLVGSDCQWGQLIDGLR